MKKNQGDVYHIRGCDTGLRQLFEELQIRLHTRTKAETLLAVCKIAVLKLDGKLEAPHPRGSIRVLAQNDK